MPPTIPHYRSGEEVVDMDNEFIISFYDYSSTLGSFHKKITPAR